MDIDSMQAGPEMNSLIAEKIMGWERIEGAETIAKLCGLPPNPEWHSKRIWIEPGTKNMMACEECGDMRPFSTDIAAAWEVVEMLKKNFHWSIRTAFDGYQEVHAGLTPIGITGWNGRPDFEATADTASLAICRAALKAAEGK